MLKVSPKANVLANGVSQKWFSLRKPYFRCYFCNQTRNFPGKHLSDKHFDFKSKFFSETFELDFQQKTWIQNFKSARKNENVELKIVKFVKETCFLTPQKQKMPVASSGAPKFEKSREIRKISTLTRNFCNFGHRKISTLATRKISSCNSKK